MAERTLEFGPIVIINLDIKVVIGLVVNGKINELKTHRMVS